MNKQGITRRRASVSVSLVLLGATALAGCGDDPVQRDVYSKLEDCQKDWGRPEKCEPVRDGRYSSSYFYGPGYSGASSSSGQPRASAHALEAARVSRGGFGSSSAFHSAGG
jgi:uncharacterized protein YgiB involved in biofilm formation